MRKRRRKKKKGEKIIITPITPIFKSINFTPNKGNTRSAIPKLKSLTEKYIKSSKISVQGKVKAISEVIRIDSKQQGTREEKESGGEKKQMHLRNLVSGKSP